MKRIDFANDIMMGKLRQIGEQHLRHNLKKWKNKGDSDILNGISENFTLVQLMYTLGNVNHAISIVGYWIFDSNYKKKLFITRESLDLICSPSFGEEQIVKFETVFYSVRYLRSPVNLNMG